MIQMKIKNKNNKIMLMKIKIIVVKMKIQRMNNNLKTLKMKIIYKKRKIYKINLNNSNKCNKFQKI